MASVVATPCDKFKPPKVFAVRDFPKGCGPLAHLANGNSSGNAIPDSPAPLKSENLGTDATATTPSERASVDKLEPLDTSEASKSEIVESAEVKTSRGLVKSEPVELSNVPIEKEKVGSSEGTLVLDVKEAGNNLDVGGELEVTKLPEETNQSKVSDLPKVEDVVARYTSKLYGPPKLRNVWAVRQFPAGCGRDALPRETITSLDKNFVTERLSSWRESPSVEEANGFHEVESGAKQVCVQEGVKVRADLVPNGYMNGRTTEETKKEKFIARVASGSLHYPEGIQEDGMETGPNSVPRDNLDELTLENKQNIVATCSSGERGHEIPKEDASDYIFDSKLQGNNVGQHNDERVLSRVAMRNKVEGDRKTLEGNLQVRKTLEGKSSLASAKYQIGRKDVGREDRVSVAKHAEAKHVKDIRFHKRKYDDELEDEDGAVKRLRLEEEPMPLDVAADRLIVVALMAEPNCPWRQLKRSGAVSHQFAMTKGNISKTRGSLGSSTARHLSKASAEDEDEEDLLPRTSKKQLASLESSVSRNVSKALAEDEDEEELLPGTSKKRLASLGPSASHHVSKALEEDEDEEDLLPQYEENEKALVVRKGPLEMSVTVTPFGSSSLNHRGSVSDEGVTRNKVRMTLRLFQVICRKLLQGEEAKTKEPGRPNRIDLKAAAILKQKNERVNTGKILGSVPGVEVGDEFHYRVELSIVGLHGPYQGGIDTMKYRNMVVATSIVASGGYADDLDDSDVLVYSGSGGNPSDGVKPAEDQKLERGNLGLKNSIEARTPVRVIRGIKEFRGSDSHDARAKQVSTFTYNGLYLVERYWKERVPQGYFVFKFQLRRMPGQPELAIKEVKRSTKSAVRKGLCIKDISEGKESIPICVVNTIDDDRPMPFKYTTKMIYPSWCAQNPPSGCDCTDGCSDSEKCACAVKNGGEIPFNFNGAIVQAKPLVYECGPLCKCPPSCHNRVSQHGIKIQLEVFKTETMGWGVRSLNSIPSGSFICEYTGELLQDKQAEQRDNDEYLFDIGHNYDDHSLWGELPALIPDLPSSPHSPAVEDAGFTIDAAEYGNVGRFINHGCSPNLYAQNVLYNHDDKRMPHIMLFAAENIPPLQELTYHYNYKIDQVRDSEGNIKKKTCSCGSHECNGRLY